MKLHSGLNSTGYLPELVTITDGKVHDVTVGRTLKFPPGSIVAIDKGYNDYAWYNQLTDNWFEGRGPRCTLSSTTPPVS